MKVNRPIRPIKKKISVVQTDEAEQTPAPPSTPATPTFKLQKLLAQKGLGSRREMEALIASGAVSVNGKTAVVGDRVGAQDLVRIGKRVIRLNLEESLPKVLLYHNQKVRLSAGMIPRGVLPYSTNCPISDLPNGLPSGAWILIPADCLFSPPTVCWPIG